MSDSTETVDEDGALEDFDAFFATRKSKWTTIRGVRVDMPPSLPLQFELEAKKLARSKKEKDVLKLVSILIGEGTYDRLVAAGLDLDQFKLLLAWGPRVVAGQDVTLAQVAAELAEAEAKSDPDEGGEEPDPS